jgi:hypothetical protein
VPQDGGASQVPPDAGGGNQAPDAVAPHASAPQDQATGGTPPDLSGVGSAYPGDNASRHSIAAWMGRAAQRRGLPPELPVMAALVESNLKNLHYGDADSVGYFQMRLGIWNSGPYAGYSSHPERQLNWFLDHAAAVKKERLAAGRSVTDPKQYGEWIADVERPAAQFRGRYQLQFDAAHGLLAQASASQQDGSAVRVMKAVTPDQVQRQD